MPIVSDDGDKTIIKPRPGKRRPQSENKPSLRPAAPVPRKPAPTAAPRSVDSDRTNLRGSAPSRNAAPLARSGLNPLLAAASPLLALVPQLRNSVNSPDISALRRYILQEIKNFETGAADAGVKRETVSSSRYILCTTLDEMVLNTPWGSRSAWAGQSLLSALHKEASGGDRFYQLLKGYLKAPRQHLEQLELMYYCLALGFQGRFRVMPDGRNRLETVRERLAQAIRKYRGQPEHELAPRWQGVTDRRNPLIRYVPLWVLSALVLVVLLLTFIGFSFSLNTKSDPVLTQLYAIGDGALPVLERTPPPPAPLPPQAISLKKLLQAEIDQRLVTVREDTRIGHITIRGDTLFGSGSATVSRNYRDLLSRIGATLNQVPGKITVAGHTDAIPIRTVRFPSNWHLSKARADSVVKILSTVVTGERPIGSEGRGASQPVAPNDSAANRARNRRVEITLLK